MKKGKFNNVKVLKREEKHKNKDQRNNTDPYDITSKKKKKNISANTKTAKSVKNNTVTKMSLKKRKKILMEKTGKKKKEEERKNKDKSSGQDKYFQITKTYNGNEFQLKFVSTDNVTNTNSIAKKSAKKESEKDLKKDLGKENMVTSFLEELNKLKNNSFTKREGKEMNKQVNKMIKRSGSKKTDESPPLEPLTQSQSISCVSKINKKISDLEGEGEEVVTPTTKKKQRKKSEQNEIKKVKKTNIQKIKRKINNKKTKGWNKKIISKKKETGIEECVKNETNGKKETQKKNENVKGKREEKKKEEKEEKEKNTVKKKKGTRKMKIKEGENNKTGDIKRTMKSDVKQNISTRTTGKAKVATSTVPLKIKEDKEKKIVKKMKKTKITQINKKLNRTKTAYAKPCVDEKKRTIIDGNLIKSKKKERGILKPIKNKKEKTKEMENGKNKENHLVVKRNRKQYENAGKRIHTDGNIKKKLVKENVGKKDIGEKDVSTLKDKIVKLHLDQRDISKESKNVELLKNEEQKELDITNEKYEDLRFTSDMYQIFENERDIHISDLLPYEDKKTAHMNHYLKLMKQTILDEDKEDYEDISAYQKEKRNAQLAYEKKKEDVDRYKYAVNTIRSAEKVELGKPEEKKEGLFGLCKNSVYKYQCDALEKQGKEIKEEADNDKNLQYDLNSLSKEELEKLESAKLDEELLHLYNISNKKKPYDAELYEQKKIEKNQTVMKIAALKRSIFNEQQKNAYKKKIKSKNYRKFIRNKDKKINEKILEKLKNNYPDISEYIAKCEEEYAKMRNMGRGEKSQKILKTLKRYKNEALRKVVLKNIQEDKEEKEVLKALIKKTMGDDGSSDTDGETEESENAFSDESIMRTGEERQLNRIEKELEKRNLLKYKFIRKGRELRKEVENLEKRKAMLYSNKRNNHDDELDISDISDTSDNCYVYSNETNKRTDPVKQQPLFSEQTLQKKTNQLLNDTTFMNTLKKTGILDTNVLLGDDDEEVEGLEQKQTKEKCTQEAYTITKDTITEKLVTDKVSAKEVVTDEDVTEKDETKEVVTKEVVTKEVVTKEVVTKEVVPEKVITEDAVPEKVVAENIVTEVISKEDVPVDISRKQSKLQQKMDAIKYEEQVAANKKHIDFMKEENPNFLSEEETVEKEYQPNWEIASTLVKNGNTSFEEIGNGSKDNQNNTKEKKVKTADTVADINAIDGEQILKQWTGDVLVYNFENNIYEKYINIDNENEIKKEKEEEIELSDSEKVQCNNIKIHEWTNLNTIIENERKKKMKEQAIIEQKKNLPLHTITVHEKPDKLFSKYYVNKLPRTQVAEEYEKSLNIMISKELNDPRCFRNLIEPKITSRYGQIIEPIRKSISKLANILKGKKDKRKPNF